MTSPVWAFRRQDQGHKRKGVGSQFQYDGAYTGELFTFVNAAAGTDVAVIAAVAGSRIRVLSYYLSAPLAGATATFTSKPGGAGTAISPLFTMGANGFATEADNNGLFQTALGQGLSITVATGTTGVRITYILVD